jgi:uncharacterized membrane protein (DUF106 family)
MLSEEYNMLLFDENPLILINFLDPLFDILESFAPSQPPASSIFILIVAFFVSLFSTLISRLMIDVDKLQRLTRETKKYNKMRMQMLKTADTKLKLKYERNADRMRKVQSELSMMRLKPLMITFIPLMLFFLLFSNYYNWDVTGNLPAIIPFPLPEQLLFRIGNYTELEGWGKVFVPEYVWWYFGGSITFGSIFQKIAGLQPD